MRLLFIILAGFSFIKINAQNNLPVYNNATETNYSKDWLVTPVTEKAVVYQSNLFPPDLINKLEYIY